MFPVVAIEVEKRRSGKNGKNGKMRCRGYLVGNGFPRVSRHGIRGGQAGIGEHR